ncbi:Sphingoid long-chain base transporter RSB1 [Escovopsis weberi]|uniref:Sphingoid long-chain base transporter RSB1 n=1 Tax=Escovopsis weberi TaxID=150374 RepID=A0A0M9VSZ1_ESCWE|nr:Sphingoid long-chain base transporter RSB1 [Escovopsis weberi]
MLGPDSLPGGPMAFPANASVPFLPNVITFGPQANCTLHICPVEWSVYKYRPSVPANAVFLALFSAALLVHVAIGWRWRSWGFMGFMVAGCLLEVVGYAGRILLHANPWSFGAFMTQIVLITCGPVFYTAAIYVTLSNIIQHLGEHISRIKPQLFYYIFIPADIVCLVLQAAGGAISVVSSGASQNGIDIALAGLGLQVASLVIFSALLADYLVRYFRHRPLSTLDLRMRVFFGFLSAAVVLVLLRCVYRCYELSQGYIGSKLVTDEGLFIGLEGV